MEPLDGPAYGSLTFREDGSFDYDPDDEFRGTDQFTYRAYDGPTPTNTTTVTIAVHRDSLSGTVYDDLNRNGARDPGEPGLEGWTVELQDVETETVTTDRDGNYYFTDLLPGEYIVRQVLPEDYFQTAPEGDGTYDVTLVGDETVSGLDFGTVYAAVTGRHVFYNNSAFDGVNDDLSIAPDKRALLPGETARFANYTSYSRGINGVMVDIANLPPAAEPMNYENYFDLKVGNDGTAWADAPSPADVAVRPGDGLGGSDRVTITWADNVIQNQWLQVTVLANSEYTGLAEPDVFYFGNAIGESGNSALDAKVNAIDMLMARNNPHNYQNPATIDSPFDFNRDARVNALDMLIVRNHQTHFLNTVALISVPETTPPEPQAASLSLDWLDQWDQPIEEEDEATADAAVDALMLEI